MRDHVLVGIDHLQETRVSRPDVSVRRCRGALLDEQDVTSEVTDRCTTLPTNVAWSAASHLGSPRIASRPVRISVHFASATCDQTTV